MFMFAYFKETCIGGESMRKKIRVAGVVNDSIVDGPGFRFSVFVQGCPHGCPGCHNPQTHPFEGGVMMEPEEILERMKKNPLLKGITLSGGEPFCQAEALAYLARQVHAAGWDVVCYTGYTLEALLAMEDPHIRELLEEVDLLIDGPFILEKRDLTLLFRGSSNQRLILVKPTLQTGSITLMEEDV